MIMVISQNQRVAQNDFESARRMLTTSFEQFPDLYFVFLTNDVATFSQLTDFVGFLLKLRIYRVSN